MTLKELQAALERIGLPAKTCRDCGRAMLRDRHCESDSSELTARQSAGMLWLCLICHDSATATDESRRLLELRKHPRKDGNPSSATVVQLLAALLSDPRRAASVDALEVDTRTRSVCASFFDLEPVFYLVADASNTELALDSTISVPGSKLCRLALAYSRTTQHKYNT